MRNLGSPLSFRGLSWPRDPFLPRQCYPVTAGRSSLDVVPLQGLLFTDSTSCFHDVSFPGLSCTTGPKPIRAPALQSVKDL